MVASANAEATIFFLAGGFVNIELISSIARSHSDELLQRASERRARRTSEAARRPLRFHLARAVLAIGDACYVVGGALIPSSE